MIRAKAVAKTVAPAEAMAAKARFRVAEPIRAAAALGVPALVRCATEPIRVAAEIRGVQPADVTAADRTVAAIHCAKEADRIGAEIRCATGDLLRGSHHGSARNVANQQSPVPNHEMDCCVRFPASCESAAEFARPFGIRFHAVDDQGERFARPERESKARSSCRRFASEQFDPVKRRPDFRG